ncbi:TPA: GNAT family N-acetyltransferase [Streptococcus suis]|nr:GNAT family N-acetyltransferase [Streptococcus suis]HEL1639822.1 GNAT family N-acetyltransferase [Streptococcus suis]
MIRLELVDETSFDAVTELTVSQQEERRVASNLYSLAQAWLYRDTGQLEPLAIWTGTQVVGFVLLAKEGQSWLIWRLMIGQEFQERGYGKEALRHLIRAAQADKNCQTLIVHYVIGNHKMRSILTSLGFRTAGMDGYEIKMELNVDTKEL